MKIKRAQGDPTLPEGQDEGRPEAWEWMEEIPKEMEEAGAE